MVTVYHGQGNMVGEKAKKSVDDFFSTVYGLPFELGKTDCFSLVVQYLKFCDAPIPEGTRIGDLTLKNYADKYLENNSIIRVADEYLTSRFNIKEPHQAFFGDVLMLEFDGIEFFGIDAGNGNVLTVNINSGVGIKKEVPIEH